MSADVTSLIMRSLYSQTLIVEHRYFVFV